MGKSKSLEEKIQYAVGDLNCYMWDKAIKEGNTKIFDWAIAAINSYKKSVEEVLKTGE